MMTTLIPAGPLVRLAYEDAWVNDRPAPAPAAREPRDGGLGAPGGALGAWLRPLLPGAAPAEA